MGVPALFRWLSQKYPKIVSPVFEEKAQEIDGVTVPLDISKPNPNGEEFDNLYLDMNGIVHPCSHPEDRPPPATEEEMMLEVFKYTERVFNMVRPRKLLMIAVDGVAPRAKMNQQRSRRFRSAQEAKEKDSDRAELLKLLRQQGQADLSENSDGLAEKKTWDSNAITPGTPFMEILAASLRYWCAYKLNTDPGWAKVKVIISDATVPGEGEHKIMEFIRSQRRSPEHNPNTRHVIYGLDADLIMLGLATHEPYFRVLREDVFFQESKQRTCRICGQVGHRAEECRGDAKQKEGDFDEKGKNVSEKPFIWLHVSVLREYLAVEMHVPEQTFRFDLERALDDWVFMCFFVGNDFLPHLPSLDIREAGIDTLITIWKDNIPLLGGYVTKDGYVDLDKAQHILKGLAKQEDSIFRRRRIVDEKREANAKRRKTETDQRQARDDSALDSKRSNNAANKEPHRNRKKQAEPTFDNLPLYRPADAQSAEVRALTHEQFVNRKAISQAGAANKSAAAVLKEQLLRRTKSDSILPSESNLIADGDVGGEPNAEGEGKSEAQPDDSTRNLRKRKADETVTDRETVDSSKTQKTGTTGASETEALSEDTVRLWEEGYADRYYQQKFHVDAKDVAFRHSVANSYVEGLAWVLLYYFQGCPSWTWYYPHHYAPFAADFEDIGTLKFAFEKGIAFRPYEQLMGVLPAASSHAIPEVFRSLMTDENSDILDYYPEDFPIDLNGKKFAWQGVALLPFIDEKRLLSAMATKYPLLTADERARNEVGRDVLLFSTQHPLYDDVSVKFYSKKQSSSKNSLDPAVSDGLAGVIEKDESYLPFSPLVSPLKNNVMPDLDHDDSISVNYDMPRSSHVHKSMLLRGVKMPPPVLDRGDVEATRNRSNRNGRWHGGAPLPTDNYRPAHYNGNSGRNQGNEWNMPRHMAETSLNPNNPFAAHMDPGFHNSRAPQVYQAPSAGYQRGQAANPQTHWQAKNDWGRRSATESNRRSDTRNGSGYQRQGYRDGNH